MSHNHNPPPPPPSDFAPTDLKAALFKTQEERRLRQRTRAIRERLRSARWWKRLRTNIHSVIDGVYSTLLTGYQLPHNSRWSLFAEMFWTDCPVCLFWRGLTFGFFVASVLATLLFLIL